MTEDEMVGQYHRINAHEFKQAPGVGDGPGSQVCCSLWGYKMSDMAEQLNLTELCEMSVIVCQFEHSLALPLGME